MRLYIKGDYSKGFPYGYMELTGKMWYIDEQQKICSNVGDNNDLQNDFQESLMLRKSYVSEEWNHLPLKDSIEYWFHSHLEEFLRLGFEKEYISDYREKGECLRILSDHEELLTVDRRAMFIMAIEVAKAIDGQISEDDKQSWLSVEEFSARHEEDLSLTFQEAHDLSLLEFPEMDPIDDPLWKQMDLEREEYIKIHGERPDDDYELYEDDWEGEVYDEDEDEYDFDDDEDDLSTDSSGTSKTFSIND